MNDVRPTPRQSTPSKPLGLPLTRTSLERPVPNFSLQPPKKRTGLTVTIIIFVFLLLLGVGAVGAYFWYEQAQRPVSSKYAQIAVDVPQGSSVEEVTGLLEQAGVVRSGLAAQIYIRQTGKDDIKAGHYLFSPNQPLAEIVSWLNEGRVNTLKVTILPGKTVAEIQQSLLDLGYPKTEVNAAFAKQYNHPLFSGKPEGTSLEGYVYPDTYFMAANGSVEDLLVRTFDELEQKIQESGVRAQLTAEGLDLYQGLTLASLTYGEVPTIDDQKVVAQVFLARLAQGMPLGSDVSFKYAAKVLGVPASPNIDSPYNTRLVVGLPPGPVSSVPITALQAVANPADTTYLFFVSGDDGNTHFSHTFEQHEENIRLYCTRLCQ